MQNLPATEVIIVRAAPGSAGAAAALEYITAAISRARCVFLHGPGVDLVAPGADKAWLQLPFDGGAEWVVCASAWKRRNQSDSLPAGWRPGSLTGFWDCAAAADRVCCFGVGT